jgi:transcriptional regulator with XRE-family HTH domain
MGAVEFGQLVARRQKELGLSQNKIASRFGELPDGRGLDSTQVRLIKEGKRILDHALVARLIVVLQLDADPDLEAEAWHTAGLQPPGATLADYRDIVRRRGANRDRRSDRQVSTDTTPAGVVVRAQDVEPRDSTPALNGAAA